ncbi:HlyD family secretion protein [Aquirufa rosea]|uniref:HlyD family efflux transporter periplasmic adaptor subunit n=1 Tax=Aquirufa rosea TaxID=2509241 RepID=A0A4Q1BZ15_9BACT|nr:HlyD family efflux transporter periplasmic adaptor subunit [Aquirufa rosea]RXK48792.1 HlyD family efflux transporter periplasmic adaptor subunit [Aquirufa rosea]
MENFKSFNLIYKQGKSTEIRFWFIGLLILSIAIIFLPWTQNIQTKGNITSLYQEQKPQKIYSPIAGKISYWRVKEGDVVNQGDTLVKITEIKEDYLDPNLIARTQDQLNAKKGSLEYYIQKVQATDAQIANLRQSKSLKKSQLENKLRQLDQKITAEKAEFTAASNEQNLAKDQLDRYQQMYKEGLISQTQFQQRNVTAQNAIAKKIAAENKVNQTVQEISNTQIELKSVDQEYEEKINKANSERLQSLGQIETNKGEVAKLSNQVTNYSIRNGMYYILAPQSGQVIQSKKAGIGEIIKDGEELLTIVPQSPNYAVEVFVRPVDLPLIAPGQSIRFIFDGFPAIVFAGGWPEQSYGTFSGKILVVENAINPNGLFRVIVQEDARYKKWPKQIKIGAGVKGIILLNDVPLWYELWRNINGFPPDFYQAKNDKNAAYEK